MTSEKRVDLTMKLTDSQCIFNEVWTKVPVVVLQNWNYKLPVSMPWGAWVQQRVSRAASSCKPRLAISSGMPAQLQPEELLLYLFFTPAFCIQFYVNRAKHPKKKIKQKKLMFRNYWNSQYSNQVRTPLLAVAASCPEEHPCWHSLG